MSIENKKVVTDPNSEEECVNHFRNLGWKATGRQEVCNQKTVYDWSVYFQESNGVGGGTVYTHVETTHFVSFLMERDTEEEGYETFQKFENDYASQIEKIKTVYARLDERKAAAYQKTAKSQNTAGLVLLLLGLAFIIIGIPMTIAVATSCAVIIAAGGVLFLLSLATLSSASSSMKQKNELPEVDKPKLTPEETKEIEGYQQELQNIDERAKAFCSTLSHSESKPKVSAFQVGEPTDAKAKLEKLKDLYDSGLITKEEYEEKRQTILKDI